MSRKVSDQKKGIAKPRTAGTIKRLQMYKNFKVILTNEWAKIIMFHILEIVEVRAEGWIVKPSASIKRHL